METEIKENKFRSYMEKNGKTVKKVLIIAGASALAIGVGVVAYAAKNDQLVDPDAPTEAELFEMIEAVVEAPTE